MSSEGSSEISLNGNADDSGHEEDENENESEEDLIEQIRKMKPYQRCERTGRIIATKSLQDLIQKLQHDAVSTWFNVFHFLRFVPDPRSSIKPRIFSVFHHPLKLHRKKKMIRIYQESWIGWMRCTVSPKVLPVMIPYISENVLDKLDEPHKTADFFFRAFDKGDKFAILSLEAIFKLIVSHNFEYPNFYDHVFSLTKPSILYMDHKEKHIPNYVVAGFAKRLSRMLLYAPLDAQEPVLGLIRNLFTRHPNISSLIHREIPETLPSDPYDDNESNLSKCNALNTSLWEIKSLQKHWHTNVAKRANFVDKKLQQASYSLLGLVICNGCFLNKIFKWNLSFDSVLRTSSFLI
ncbi:hypothetical protein KIN20_033021 [Parelaphostrongylus tenuis]|uniref:CCAAT-binding factor domain-containing protein n=1 Tax=Parelaphostrongylus tenuis TaxID=148309 RepID=A0AAD5WIJ0_PARTN|nr:hypothetical protein KIN20_033021 [Parelaphostrongylus tenuis]